MKSHMTKSAVTAVVLLFGSAGVGLADRYNFVRVPDGTNHLGYLGHLRTNYTKEVTKQGGEKYFIYTTTTHFKVKKLNPNKVYVLICYANTGDRYIDEPFSPDTEGTFTDIVYTGPIFTSEKFHYDYYEIWRCEYDTTLDEWVPSVPVLKSKPEAKGHGVGDGMKP